MSSSPGPPPTRFFESSSPELEPFGSDDANGVGGLAGGRRSSSRFTYRQLAQLAVSSTSCPLRVIAHIDLDAFYAQCEVVRLGIDPDKPLACQQWQGLIAVNYPARKFGIGRFCTIEEAKKLCPELILAHVATWREGDETWAYHEDAAANIATHKVSLDPYRMESRKILALIKECLPPHQRKVEKASIDEVFIDLSANVHSILLERFPELSRPPPRDDPTGNLPPPPVSALDWQADALVGLGGGGEGDDDGDEEGEQREQDDPDWDDVALLVGSEIVRGIRRRILDELRYTCSAGLATNKMLSKLGSAHRKPNSQTVVRARATRNFLSGIKFTKIRNLGGKLGEQVAESFGTELVGDLLKAPLEQLQAKLGEERGVWVYDTIRGADYSEVSSRTQIKSMLSAKSFRPTIGSLDQGLRWLRIFAADIFSRLVEEGVLEGKRWPRTLTIHHLRRGDKAARSRSCQIPRKGMDEVVLFGLAEGLFRQLVVGELGGNAWPCSNLSLNVSGFEDGVTGNMGIGGFLVKGEEAQALTTTSDTAAGNMVGHQQQHHQPETKRRRVNEGGTAGGIQRFFAAKRDFPGGTTAKGSSSASFGQLDATSSTSSGSLITKVGLKLADGADAEEASSSSALSKMKEEGRKRELFEEASLSAIATAAVPDHSRGGCCYDDISRGDDIEEEDKENEEEDEDEKRRPIINHAYQCRRCYLECGTQEELQSHLDWHLARDLQDEEERGALIFAGRGGGGPTTAAVVGSEFGSGAGAAAAATTTAERRPRRQASSSSSSSAAMGPAVPMSRRGRPPGSRNKKKTSSTSASAASLSVKSATTTTTVSTTEPGQSRLKFG